MATLPGDPTVSPPNPAPIKLPLHGGYSVYLNKPIHMFMSAWDRKVQEIICFLYYVDPDYEESDSSSKFLEKLKERKSCIGIDGDISVPIQLATYKSAIWDIISGAWKCPWFDSGKVYVVPAELTDAP